MVKREYVCRNCRRFTTEKECPICKSRNLSSSWKGVVVIINPQECEISQTLGIDAPGKYALFVG